MLCRFTNLVSLVLAGFILASCGPGTPGDFDVIIRGGTVYDGSGNDPIVVDVAIAGDRIESIGNLSEFTGTLEIDAQGMAVAPGFINMLSWATETLIEDGRAMSDVMQGVTLEVLGD